MRTLLSNWKALAGLCLIFAFGCIAGALVERIVIAKRVRQYLQGGPAMAVQTAQRRLTRDLSLDADQQARLHDILADTLHQVQHVRSQTQPQVRTILTGTRTRIEAILRPDQVTKFHDDLDRARGRFGRLSAWQAPEESATSDTNAPTAIGETNSGSERR